MLGRRHIAPMLIALARQYSQLDLTLTYGERTVDMINDGIDLAVRIGDLKDDPELVARRLGDQHLVICAAPTTCVNVHRFCTNLICWSVIALLPGVRDCASRGC